MLATHSTVAFRILRWACRTIYLFLSCIFNGRTAFGNDDSGVVISWLQVAPERSVRLLGHFVDAQHLLSGWVLLILLLVVGRASCLLLDLRLQGRWVSHLSFLIVRSNRSRLTGTCRVLIGLQVRWV